MKKRLVLLHGTSRFLLCQVLTIGFVRDIIVVVFKQIMKKTDKIRWKQ